MYVSIPQIDIFQPSQRSMQPTIKIQLAKVGLCTITVWQVASSVMANNLLPDADIPEEVLRAEIITEARSPISGKALSAQDFAELVVTTKQQLDRDDAIAATTNPKFKEAVLLLRLRGFLKSIGVPIK